MSLEFMQPEYDLPVVALSVLIASFASYVSLDLAGRVRNRDPLSALMWTAIGALVMGSGIWSMHFVGMLALSLPVVLGYDPLVTVMSWVAAVAVSGLALSFAARPQLSNRALLAGAGLMASGICAMHYLGMGALEMSPPIVWNPWLVVASAVIAATASAAALRIFFWRNGDGGPRGQAAKIVAALVMGLAISGMHYTGSAAAGFPAGTVCLSQDGLGGLDLGLLVAVACVILLCMGLFASALEARMQATVLRLAATLASASEQLKGANAELQQMALRDPLTGVANRVLFQERLGQALQRLDQGAIKKLGLLFIDLDGFKPVNDGYGHAAGDEVLRQVADRLRAGLREHDVLARIGGDEFVVLVERVRDASELARLGQRMIDAMAPPFEVAGRPVSLSCSIGGLVHPDQGQREMLIADADAAMYAAKRGGGGAFALFEPHMHEDVSAQIEMRQSLREAIERGQLFLHYQPKVDGRSGELKGLEALLRWTHPLQGPIPPDRFIAVAERFGLIVPLGNWVIDEACRQLAAWRADGIRLTVSINLSAHQLRQTELVDQVRSALQRHGVDPQQLMCEITESAAMEHGHATHQVIEGLTAIGVRLSIDDFGTGHSSLASLRQLRVRELKIDRMFIRDIAVSQDARAIVDAIVRLAHALGLRVVAEGVETPQQREVLNALGCDEQQGFLFARPMPAAELIGTQAGRVLAGTRGVPAPA
ncbi:putative bifunctional diguanylate cyclase/phosphodiesterase [Caldimonas tepidiphila]|uniref:putative bifunctional diguanylate cyclase/phosphodiesterase n=1 Tax=Caldimonas tepidiphila TaxID=2315841 RepID=UPI000E5B233C|nr:EAL domain-containing protein [Caldimonas tepidiphila]